MTECINHPNVKFYPLHRACQNGRESMTTIDFLLQEDNISEKINEEDDIKCTPLFYAAEYGHLHTARKLIDNGADVNHADKHGRTAFWYAADMGHFDMIKLLLENKFTFINKRGDIADETALDRAACNGHWDTVEHMIDEIEHLDINNCDRDGETVLTMAAEAGQLEIVKKLISKGADVNNRCKRGISPLCKAIGGKHSEVIAHLLKNGSDVNNTCCYGETPCEKAHNVNYWDEFIAIYKNVFGKDLLEVKREEIEEDQKNSADLKEVDVGYEGTVMKETNPVN